MPTIHVLILLYIVNSYNDFSRLNSTLTNDTRWPSVMWRPSQHGTSQPKWFLSGTALNHSPNGLTKR